MTISIEVQTRTGYAVFILVRDQLIVWFYMGDAVTTSVQFKVVEPDMLYDDGAWNIGLLAWVILGHEPFKNSAFAKDNNAI